MRRLFFCKISGEMLLHQAGGAHRAQRKGLLMGAQLNAQGFLPVAFVPVTFYNKSKDNSFEAFLILMDTVNIKSKIYALLHDANIEITAEM